MDYIAIKLKSLRTDAGLTLKSLGENTGISLSYLSDIENGRTVPSVATLARLADYYQIPIAALVGGSINVKPINDDMRELLAECLTLTPSQVKIVLGLVKSLKD